jgi:hypothetical protein
MGDTFHRIHQKLNQTNAKLKTNAPPLHKQTGPRTALHKDNKTHESLADSSAPHPLSAGPLQGQKQRWLKELWFDPQQRQLAWNLERPKEQHQEEEREKEEMASFK